MKQFLTILIFAIGLQVMCSAQSNHDFEAVVQKTLDVKGMQEYYHPEIEGRVPIKIVDNDVIPILLRITKFNQEVEFWDEEALFQLGTQFL